MFLRNQAIGDTSSNDSPKLDLSSADRVMLAKLNGHGLARLLPKADARPRALG